MMRLLNRVLAFFRRRRQPAYYAQQQSLLQGSTYLHTIRGVVTSLCPDHGWIDDCIFFHNVAVTGNVPLRVGQQVIAVVEEEETAHRLEAIKVEPFSHPFDCNGLSGLRTRLLISCVTAVTSDAVYISNDTYFSMDIVSEGFVPYKGDWIQVEYSTQPGTSNIIAHSLKPTNCSHIDEVYISNMHGSQGVIDDAIFFTLDSLKLPPGYVPQLHDLVDVVIVESAQSCYTWRAVSMTPVQMSQ
ncbi:cancer/testis antigen 55-like [Castor canadensis]|uniref:Cancer/testis antigen 55-like n=1 Tax=Castor canadensis TaxID=51338 RepID=A0A8B7TYV6_CASCN|nr:LOW QUALITY PROTEIN: cancer/testis antigen 55-like [Castor canadensis]XP_020010533.1 cancer/testis antigen 55-like [Castor canadensis]XP_020010555.1 cancer/testis antigen 55-like [Castor canadensis]